MFKAICYWDIMILKEEFLNMWSINYEKWDTDLQTLMEHKEKIVSREELMEKLWESDAYVDENTLSVNVNRLRKKLSSVGLDDFILTKKGIGYRIGWKL